MKIAYEEAFRPLHANPCPFGTVIPPNRLESSNWDLLAALARARSAGSLAALQAALCQLLGRDQIFFAPSARCAIAQLLSLLPQKEVVMPAFNCDVVKSAVEAAGKHIVYVDLAKGSVNATAAEFSKVAQPGRILLATHQFGVPTDVEAICELARSRGCITIEDAACSFGARRNGQCLGTFADFGVFSFESWKRLPAFQGGAIVVNNDRLIDANRLANHTLVKTTLKMPRREVAYAMGRNVATNPWLYGRLTLPVLIRNYLKHPVTASGGKKKDVTKGLPYTREFHPYQAQLVLRMLARMDPIREQIAQLVSIYADAFKDGSVMTFLPSDRDDAGLLRFPIAFPGKDRAEVLRRALKRGLYLETAFEEPLPEPGERSQFPNSVWVGRNLVLLPLYTTLQAKAAAWLAAQVNEIARDPA